MTREEAIKVLDRITVKNIEQKYNTAYEIGEALNMAINALEIVKEFERAQIITGGRLNGRTYAYKCGLEDGKRKALEQEPQMGHCKDCKYFEYDSVAKIDGIPLIVAHEICSKWGDGCKTKENGYCFLFEPQESEG